MSNPVSDAAARAEALDPLRSFCVTAPAGSGKTELLTQRFLTLLARVEHPQEVLAITFTRKAAAEMRSRIGLALTKAAEEGRPDGEHAALTYDLARQVLAADEQRQWQLRANPSQLNIRTIDGFCGAITRQMPVLSRFGGPVAAVDDSRGLYRQAARALLEQLETGGPGSEELGKLLLHFDNNWQRLEGLLVSMLDCRDQWLVSLGAHLNPVQAQNAVDASLAALSEDTLGAADNALAAYANELLSLWAYSNDCLGLPAREGWPGCGRDQVADWQALANLLLTAAGDWRKTVDKRNGFPAGKGVASERKAEMLALLETLSANDSLLRTLREIRLLPANAVSDEHWELVLTCTRLLPLLAAQLTVVFQSEGAVDHTQVALAALDALGEDERPTDLALALDYRLKHILVDEFQDTSVNQFELVRRLTRGWAEHNAGNPEAPRTLFIVGDGMQSIYGFRNADVGLFIRAKQQGFDDLALDGLTLSTNFRSREAVVDWVNRTFESAFPSADNIQHGEIAYTPAVAFQGRGEESAVRIAAFEGPEYEAEWMAEQIADAMPREGCDSIAVLVRRKADIAWLVPALKRRGIEWQAQEIDTLADSMVVRDLANLCRALHNPLDRVAWLALLRAPWCGLDNADLLQVAMASRGHTLESMLLGRAYPEQISQDGRQRLAGVASALVSIMDARERLSLRDWTELAWLALGGPTCVETASQLEDAEAFFIMLDALEADRGHFEPVHLTERLEKLYASSGHQSKLQLMTLHKAKGLEFDWVFLPNLAHRTRPDDRELLLWDDYLGLDGSTRFLLAMYDPNASGAGLYDFLFEQRKAKRQLESTRLLYVGATRAVQRLFLSATLQVEEGELKAPGETSLLGRIWPAVEGAVERVEVPAVADTQEPELAVATYRLPQPLTASAQVDGVDGPDPNLPERKREQLAAAVGSVIHLTLERLSAVTLPDVLDASAYTDWWRQELMALGVGHDKLEAALERVEASIQAVLTDEQGCWLLAGEHEDARSELPLSCLLPDGRLAEFLIDRTFVADGERWVVDYKSAIPDPSQSLEDFLAEEAERYRGQLETYARLLGEQEDRPLRCALYFTALPHLHELSLAEPPPAPE